MGQSILHGPGGSFPQDQCTVPFAKSHCPDEATMKQL